MKIRQFIKKLEQVDGIKKLSSNKKHRNVYKLPDGKIISFNVHKGEIAKGLLKKYEKIASQSSSG